MKIVIIFDEEKHRELHYRVLGVFKKYYNKWFHPKPNEDSTPFSTGKPPSIRLSLRMMTPHKRVGTAAMHQAEEMYTAVETYDEYDESKVHRNVAGNEILRVEGHLSPQM